MNIAHGTILSSDILDIVPFEELDDSLQSEIKNILETEVREVERISLYNQNTYEGNAHIIFEDGGTCRLSYLAEVSEGEEDVQLISLTLTVFEVDGK